MMGLVDKASKLLAYTSSKGITASWLIQLVTVEVEQWTKMYGLLFMIEECNHLLNDCKWQKT